MLTKNRRGSSPNDDNIKTRKNKRLQPNQYAKTANKLVVMTRNIAALRLEEWRDAPLSKGGK
jgi:hypothetical protein